MNVTPIHLSGAKCGDHVLFMGEELGTIHHWMEGGAAVRLSDVQQKRCGLIRVYFYGDHSHQPDAMQVSVVTIFLSDEQFVDPRISVVPF